MFFTQFQSYCEDFWESTFRKPCSQSHTRFKAYKIHCIHSKSYCLLGVEKSCTNLARVILSSGIKELILGCIKIKITKISSGLLGTGRRSQRPNQDKISCVCICIFSEIYFLSCKLFYLTLIIFVWVLCWHCILDPQLASSRDQQLVSEQGWQQNFLHRNSKKDIIHNVHHYLMDQSATLEV